MAQRKRVEADPSPRSMDEDPVVRGIIKAISLKRIRPGAKLGEDQLVDAFGTNRIHVRNVLAYLGSRGIVTQYPNRGAYVTEPSVEEARGVFRTRRILERAAIEALVPRLTEQDIEEIRNHLETETKHLADDRWNTLSVTGDFHALIGHLSGNAVLAKFLEELVLRTSLIIATYEPSGSADCSYDAHPDIAEKLIARDAPAAVAAMDAHLIAMESRLPLDATPEAPTDIAAIFAELGVGASKSKRRKSTKKSDATASL
jgi:DNA-binding GntR family transcriptional regulator